MVSVIIPVYQAEKTLPSCVQSVLNQTYTDYEIILIDDGSKDRSGQLCDELRDLCLTRGVRCQVIHQENGGVSRARNCGMDRANGEFFVCVDSDDVVEPCYLEDLVRAAEAHPEFGHVICGFKCTSHVHDYILTDREPLSVADRRDYMVLYEKILVQGPCFALYRTEIVRRNGIRMREDFSRAEDTLFNLEYLDALDKTVIGIVNKSNYIYQNEDQSSLYRRYRQDLLTTVETVNQALAHYLNKWGICDEESQRKFYSTVYYNYRAVLDNTFHRENTVPFREKIAYNTGILKKESFREAVRKGGTAISPALRRAYESGDYRRVLAVERVQRIKQTVHGLLK